MNKLIDLTLDQVVAAADIVRDSPKQIRVYLLGKGKIEFLIPLRYDADASGRSDFEIVEDAFRIFMRKDNEDGAMTFAKPTPPRYLN